MKYVNDYADRLGYCARTVGYFCEKGGLKLVLGRIHSFESMGLVDGPGIRSVVFLQGCHLRCRYCHNPDTWNLKEEKVELLSAKDLVDKLIRFKPYYRNNGGVTFSGGEPLLQKEFLLKVLPLCKEAGIHTCLDTSGFGDGDYEEILKNTDLVLFDIKHYKEEEYKSLTGADIEESLKFLEVCQKMNKPLWIRHVVIPNLTDSDEHLRGLLDFIKTLKNIEKVELLPYHILGVNKYEKMGIPYSLRDTKPMEQEKVQIWQEKINRELLRKG